MVSAKELNPTAMGSIQPGDPPKTRRGRDAGYQETKNSTRGAGEGASDETNAQARARDPRTGVPDPERRRKKFHQSMKRGRLYTWQWQTVARRTGGWSETGGVWFLNLDRGKTACRISSHLRQLLNRSSSDGETASSCLLWRVEMQSLTPRRA